MLCFTENYSKDGDKIKTGRDAPWLIGGTSNFLLLTYYFFVILSPAKQGEESEILRSACGLPQDDKGGTGIRITDGDMILSIVFYQTPV